MRPLDDIEALSALKLSELRQAWRNRFNVEAPRLRSRDLLLRAFVYRLESETFGDLKPQLKKRLTELADRFADDPSHDPAPRIAPSIGSALVRDWNGVRHLVLVTPEGFQYRDKTYRSLTQVAKAISGQHRSGPSFFGLVGNEVETEA
jgi:hypothetical protein